MKRLFKYLLAPLIWWERDRVKKQSVDDRAKRLSGVQRIDVKAQYKGKGKPYPDPEPWD